MVKGVAWDPIGKYLAAQATGSEPPFRPQAVSLIFLPTRFDQCVLFVFLQTNFVCRLSSGEVQREQKMLEGHLPRVMYHQVY